MIWKLFPVAALAVAALMGCGGAKPIVAIVEEPTAPAPAPDPVATRIAYQPTAGVTRAEAEAVIGPASWTGWTKEGNLLCRYQIEGAPEGIVKSIIYDRDGKAVEWYR